MDTVEEHNSDIYRRELGPPMKEKRRVFWILTLFSTGMMGKKTFCVVYHSFQHSLIIV